MSLTTLVERPEVKSLLDSLLPAYTRNLRLERQVAPASSARGHAAVVGTAFDYALRFEIRRMARFIATRQDVRTRRWIAEDAAERYQNCMNRERTRQRFGPSQEADVFKALCEARVFEAQWADSQRVTSKQRRKLAWHCARLASIDSFYRAGTRALPFRLSPSEAVVADVASLLAHAPVADMLGEGPVALNPSFGTASLAAGGADADIVIGDLLVDVKTTRKCLIERDISRQLMGYMLLSRVGHVDDSRVPLVRRIGVYFARFAHLFVFEPIRAAEAQMDAAAEKLMRLAALARIEAYERQLQMLGELAARTQSAKAAPALCGRKSKQPAGP